jgi:hypothetical protein
MELLRIIPVDHKPHDLCMTNGTKVVTPKGEELHGVTDITLRCGINDIWRAEISFLIDPPEVTCLEDREFKRYLSAHEVARLHELEAERNELVGRQIPMEHALIDFRREFA